MSVTLDVIQEAAKKNAEETYAGFENAYMSRLSITEMQAMMVLRFIFEAVMRDAFEEGVLWMMKRGK